jgi:hypothetical protein
VWRWMRDGVRGLLCSDHHSYAASMMISRDCHLIVDGRAALTEPVETGRALRRAAKESVAVTCFPTGQVDDHGLPPRKACQRCLVASFRCCS